MAGRRCGSSTADAVVATVPGCGQRGRAAVEVTAAATADCVLPTISDVTMSEMTARRAVVTFTTSEPTQGKVRFGADCGSLDKMADEAGFHTYPPGDAGGLKPAGTYRFTVEVA